MNQTAGEIMEEVKNKTQNENDYYLNQWANDFGDGYSERCDVDYEKRVPIYDQIFDWIEWPNHERKVLEMGANRGHNLVAIDRVLHLDEINGKGKPIVRGVEPNKSAIKLSGTPESICLGSLYNIPYIDESFDFVFTSGVLIHIPRKGLEQAFKEMARVSSKYIMMIEYESENEEGRHYREFDKDGVWSRLSLIHI